ncbi:DUF1353 domain-containing protein [Caulobacter sp. SL161]|uniref:DUF1353 domain-containing protein n=1 Tax=Caulobacter sp. SL161 TaxID=2995156 RepID=UPI003FA39185
MSAFTGELTITELNARKGLWRLEEQLRYEVGSKGSGRWVIAPAGMTTDGATTMIFRPILPAWGTYSRAAVIHDHLCDLLRAGRPHPEAQTYAAAARVFREAAKVAGTSLPVRWAMWAAIRLWFALRELA